jgi:hypothetical protein
MTGLWRPTCLIGLAAALILSSSGCTDYTYFNVNVSVDPSVAVQSPSAQIPALEQINDCFVYVLDKSGRSIEGAGKELLTTESSKQGTQKCSPGDITNSELGVLDYSTTRGSGTLTFLVSMTKYDSQAIPPVTPTFLDGSAKGEGPVIKGAIYVDLVVTPCKDPKDPNPVNTDPAKNWPTCNPVGSLP